MKVLFDEISQFKRLQATNLLSVKNTVKHFDNRKPDLKELVEVDEELGYE